MLSSVRAAARHLGALALPMGLLVAAATLLFHVWGQWHEGLHHVSSLTHTMPEGDFSLLWSAGRMAHAGYAQQVYDGPSLLAWRGRTLGPGWSRLDWMYPPPMLALGALLSAIPLSVGYAVWVAAMCVASMWALRSAGLSWRVVLVGLFGPPTWLSLTLGQYAPLAGTCVVAGLLQARRRPARAGVLVALATLKPHLGLLVPLVWLIQRRWRAFGVGIVVTLVLAAGSTLLLGGGIWPAFLRASAESGGRVLGGFFRDGYPLWSASLFWSARSFGASVALAGAVQGMGTGMAACAVCFAARRGDDTAAAAVAAVLMPLVSPYLYAFDLIGYSIVVAMMAERGGFAPLWLMLWLAPGVSEAFTLLTARQVLPLCIVVAAALAWWTLRDGAPIDTPPIQQQTAPARPAPL